MSKETLDAVAAAVRAHMADENDGALVTAWLVISHGVDANDSQIDHYQYLSPDCAPHELIGLAGMAQRKWSFNGSFGEETDE